MNKTNNVAQSKTTFHLSIHIPIPCNDKIKKIATSAILLTTNLKLLLIVIDGQKNNNNLPPKIYWKNVLDVTFLKNQRSESHILIDPIKRYLEPLFVL